MKQGDELRQKQKTPDQDGDCGSDQHRSGTDILRGSSQRMNLVNGQIDGVFYRGIDRFRDQHEADSHYQDGPFDASKPQNQAQ